MTQVAKLGVPGLMDPNFPVFQHVAPCFDPLKKVPPKNTVETNLHWKQRQSSQLLLFWFWFFSGKRAKGMNFVCYTYCWCFRNPIPTHRLDGAKTVVNNGDFNYSYQPQLVFLARFLNHQLLRDPVICLRFCGIFSFGSLQILCFRSPSFWGVGST